MIGINFKKGLSTFIIYPRFITKDEYSELSSPESANGPDNTSPETRFTDTCNSVT